MNLFEKYDLWSFFSLMLSYLLKDFHSALKEHISNIKITILRDKKFKLNDLKKTNWKLIKNNIQKTTGAKLRFLMSESDYRIITTLVNEEQFLGFFTAISKRLKRMTFIDEIENFTASTIFDPVELGHIDKYYAIHIMIKLGKNRSVKLIFIIRDEMLLFPLGRISTDPILDLSPYYYKKAFIELDKEIIWDGMNNWGTKLTKRFEEYINDYPEKKYNLKKSDDPFAYKLLLQYLFLLKLKSRDHNN